MVLLLVVQRNKKIVVMMFKMMSRMRNSNAMSLKKFNLLQKYKNQREKLE